MNNGIRHIMLAIDANPVETYRRFLHEQANVLATMPKHMQPGIARYVLLGIKPGSFLCAIFAHEDEIAERKADDINRGALPAYRDFLGRGCPADCHGSSQFVREWCEGGGLVGRLAGVESGVAS